MEPLESRQVLSLTITEINYDPDGQGVQPPQDAQDFEFIELQNRGAAPLDITNYRITEGVTFTFPARVLQPNEFVVVAKNTAAFQARYPGVTPIGQFTTGSLASNGEELAVVDGSSVEVLRVDYEPLTKSLADGAGFTLVLRDGADPSVADNWRPSAYFRGSPGAKDDALPKEAVRINEILTHTDLGLGDRIELLNTTDQPIDISGWYLSDRDNTPENIRKYKIPAGTVIQPGQFLVFNQFADFDNPANPNALVPFSFSEFGNQKLGDENEVIALVAVKPGTNPTDVSHLGGYRESQPFGPSEREATFGVHVKTEGGTDFTTLKSATFGGPNDLPQVGPIVINEVMYLTSQPSDQYIELKNISDQPVQLFDPANPSNTWKFTSGIDFVFPNTQVTVPAFGFVLIVNTTPAAFRAAHPNVPAAVPVFGPFLQIAPNPKSLGASGDDLAISYPGDPDNQIAGGVPYYVTDRVNYQHGSGGWVQPGVGVSISRRLTFGGGYGNDSENWGNDQVGGSPGLENQTGPPSFALSVPDVEEGDSGQKDYTFRILIDSVPTQEVAVQYSVTGNDDPLRPSATPGEDFVAVSGAVTFTAGEQDLEKLVTVKINGDTTIEEDERFLVTLSNPTGGATIAQPTGRGKILNDDKPTFTIGDVSIAEGNSGQANLVFTVTLTPAHDEQATIVVSTQDESATAGSDYVSVLGSTLTFSVGQTTQTVAVPVLGDTSTGEGNETFRIALAGASGGTRIGDALGIGTILDDDNVTPTVSIAPPAGPVAEGSSGTTQLVVPVTLSIAAGQEVRVAYETVNDSAAAPGDFEAASGTLTFAPGVTSQPITINIQADTLYELDETFKVRISNPAGADLGNSEAVVTIANDDLPSVGVGDVQVVEGDSGTTDMVFTLNLSSSVPVGATTLPRVRYRTEDVTALAGEDYNSVDATATFQPGSNTASVTVQIRGDTTDENNESFGLILSDPVGLTITDAEADGRITDNDQVVLPSISIANQTINEGSAGPHQITLPVTLSAASSQTVTVFFQTEEGTATAPEDYSLSGQTLTFSAGVTAVSITLTIKGDTEVEPDEAFTVRLSSPTGATLSNPLATVTITNDDLAPAPKVSIADASVIEGNSGQTSLLFTVTVQDFPSGQGGATATVVYGTQDGTATTAGGDYTSAGGTLTFSEGTTSATITVSVQGDTAVEENENFRIVLSQPSGLGLSIDDGEATGTINNDDAAAIPTVSIQDNSTNEGSSGTKDLVLLVSLSEATNQEVKVAYTTVNGSAVAPGDYLEQSGTLTFAAGVVSRPLTVKIVGDTQPEPTESFSVELSNPTGATLGDASAAVTIVSDDLPASMTVADAQVVEGNVGTTANLVFTISIAELRDAAVTVQYATSSVSSQIGATADVDYVPVSGTATIGPGALEAKVTVVVKGDNVSEQNEFFQLNLSNPVGANLTDNQAIGTILDDETGSFLSVGDAAVAEGNSGTSNLVFTVARVGNTDGSATVRYATTDGTASSPGDYAAAEGTLTFEPGVTSATITVQVVGDAAVESDETLTLALSSPTGGSIADGQAAGTIQNDDAASHPWQNPNASLRQDVDNDGLVVSLDALIIIDKLNSQGPHALANPPVAPDLPPPYFDVSGDDYLAPIDALMVIDRINGRVVTTLSAELMALADDGSGGQAATGSPAVEQAALAAPGPVGENKMARRKVPLAALAAKQQALEELGLAGDDGQHQADLPADLDGELDEILDQMLD